MRLSAKLKGYKRFLYNLIIPAIIFGFITGFLTAVLIVLYKLLAEHVIKLSMLGYELLRDHLYFVPIVLIAFYFISWLISYVHRVHPNIKGGGIATSVGILRGIITFKWLRNVIEVFLLSLLSFLIGVPVGNEGPSVQMGTALGRGGVYTFAKKHRAWDRYTMTGGACAGFSVATGAPISGIIFAIEEAHQRISPTIMMVASSSVVFASITSKVLSPIFGVSTVLFEGLSLPTLSVSGYWIPLVIGIVIGIFGVFFLGYYKLIHKLIGEKLRISNRLKIFIILSLTLVLGLISTDFISTGHALIDDLMSGKMAFYVLLIIILVRSSLTISANERGVLGGTFLPMLAIGASVGALLANGYTSLLGENEMMYTLIIVLSMCASIAGVMKCPLTAIIFGIEVFSCVENIIPVIIVSLFSYLITEMFGVKSINDSALELRLEELNKDKVASVVDTYVTVNKGSFAVGKQIRDIFWPANLFVLSVKKASSDSEEVDEHGGKALRAGDELHIQYSTFDNESTEDELYAIVGIQK